MSGCLRFWWEINPEDNRPAIRACARPARPHAGKSEACRASMASAACYRWHVSTPTYGIICQELHAARGHLYAMIEGLSQDELLWIPPRPDGISISYHFGHIALVEDLEIAPLIEKPVLARPDVREVFGVQNANNPAARFPPGAAILDYMQGVRERTLGIVALRFRAIRNLEAAVDAAEPFRRTINHEYSHTKYIRRIRAEMGKPPVDPPQSERIEADPDAIAPPQYSLPSW
jgi:hypothetical protein